MARVMFGLSLALAIACGGRSVRRPDDSVGGAGTDTGGASIGTGGASSDTGGASIGTGGASSDTGGSSTDTGGVGTGQGGVSTGGIATGGSPSGARAGFGGRGGGANTTPVCDPDIGELNNTPYPDCEAHFGDACELCAEANCCEESMFCYGYDPGNVCGWGGPTTGAYAGLSEVACFTTCARDYVGENGAFDDGAVDTCSAACTTEACGLIGNATQDILVCMMDRCETDCFWP